MGFWGPGLYDCDCTSDIQDSVQRLIESGISPCNIKKRILQEFSQVWSDPHEGPLSKLALAENLHRLNCLSDEDRISALSFLQNGADFAFWDGTDISFLRLREKEFQRLELFFMSPPPKLRLGRKMDPAKFEWLAGDVFAVPFSSEDASQLGLIGQYIILCIVDKDFSFGRYRIPKVWIKITRDGRIPETSQEINALPFVQIACTKMQNRFLPYSSADELPEDFIQEYFPDAWGYLQEYSVSIIEGKDSHPPDALHFVGNFANIQPPWNNYTRYKSAHSIAWRYFEEMVVKYYHLYNMRQAKIFKSI